MTKYLPFICLIFLGGCATKYLIPSNRFYTPETNGGALKGQAEYQYTSAQQLTINTSQGNVEEGVKYSKTMRSGFQVSESLFDPFDILWAHNTSSNSLGGFKLQFIGGSKAGNATGHKLAGLFMIGGNQHTGDDVKFRLDAQEVFLIYGYRIDGMLLPYASLGRSTYKFDGEIINGGAGLNGLTPQFTTKVTSLNTGLELNYLAYVMKLEGSYQSFSTTDTKKMSSISLGLSAGLSW